MYKYEEDNIEKLVTQGNIIAYYHLEDMGCADVVAEVKGLPIGRTRINLRYEEGYLNWKVREYYTRTLTVDYQGVSWMFSCANGTVVNRIDTYSAGRREQYANQWAIANEPDKNFPKRLKKAQKIFDYFYNIVINIPLVQKYIDGFENYLARKKAKEKERMSRQGDKARRDMEQWKKRFKGTPDPLNPLFELVESAQPSDKK